LQDGEPSTADADTEACDGAEGEGAAEEEGSGAREGDGGAGAAVDLEAEAALLDAVRRGQEDPLAAYDVDVAEETAALRECAAWAEAALAAARGGDGAGAVRRPPDAAP
jgi:hypothetical protein